MATKLKMQVALLLSDRLFMFSIMHSLLIYLTNCILFTVQKI